MFIGYPEEKNIVKEARHSQALHIIKYPCIYLEYMICYYQFCHS